MSIPERLDHLQAHFDRAMDASLAYPTYRSAHLHKAHQIKLEMEQLGKRPVLSSSHQEYPDITISRMHNNAQTAHQLQHQNPQITHQLHQQTPQTVPQSQEQQIASTRITVNSLLNPLNVGVFITTSTFKVPLFVRIMLTNLKPFFTSLMPLFSAALFMLITTLFMLIGPFTIEVYTLLINLCGEQVKYIILMLFYFLCFLARLLLMIRKAQKLTVQYNKLIVQYDKLFYFAANHYKSVIIYFFILLLSVALVYLCICDCNCFCECNSVVMQLEL